MAYMSIREHLNKAREYIENGEKYFGNGEEAEARVAAEAHIELARAKRVCSGRNRKLIEKCEDLLRPGGAEEAYGNTLEGLLKAKALAKLARHS